MVGPITVALFSFINILVLIRWEIESWVELCYRDVLKIVWNMTDVSQNELFLKMVPKTKPISVSLPCCQNFVMSRDVVHRRPLSVWKSLYKIIALQDVCHEGEPDYTNLFASNHIGPEGSLENGRHTQGILS